MPRRPRSAGRSTLAAPRERPYVRPVTVANELAGGPADRARPSTGAVVAPGRGLLREILILADVAALLSAWSLALLISSGSPRAVVESLGIAVLVSGAGVWLMYAHELYLSRISTVRSLELARVVRSIALTVIAAIAIARVLSLPVRIRELAVGGLVSLLMVVIARSSYRSWLNEARRSGRHLRDILLVGADRDAAELYDLISTHPEAGFRVVGVTGDRTEATANGLAGLYCGPVDDTLMAAQSRHVSGVIVSVGAVPADGLNGLLRILQLARLHIHLSNGVRGTDYRRLRAAPIMYEPLFYLESSPGFERHKVILKRALDLTVSVAVLLVAAPVFVACALAVKLQDGGPVFFKQVRVGRDGEPFKVFKFRTMVVDAEAKLAELMANNARSGPLFKMDRDPRITRIGRFLRSSSLDELPQLLNVLRGEMSLVGPRPALPREVESFDDELVLRNKALPGITGLWQVEARDNPSFSAYRRLDLFYVHNWSLSLDLIILLATAEQVVAKFVQALGGGRRD
jgi:exopolysaccharide biosynthesis polyprenyl glycosylphosphotransferase